MKHRVIRYRKYETFNSDALVNNLRKVLTKQKKVLDEKGFDAFSEICTYVLDKHPPQRKRYLRSNHKPFMTRTRLRNRILKSRSNGNRDLFRKQRNLCVSLLRKAKKDYFSKLNEKQITDNKRFWKTVKPFLSNKVQSSERINLTGENDSLVTDCGKVAEELNSFFSSVVKNLYIPNYEDCDPLSDNIDTLKAIVKWRNHPSILTITSEHENTPKFSFNFVSKEHVLEEIQMMDSSKAIQESDIPVKLIKENSDLFPQIICKYFNESLEKIKFPDCLKLENVTPVFKKDARNSKNDYRPVSILPISSELFERLISKQLSEFFESILSKFQCGFRKGYGAQHCLLMMLETWKEAADNNKAFGELLTDLSKAFDCLSHDLLIAKLHAYGLDLASLKILQDCLTNRKQRTKVDSFYSSWEKVLSGMPQGSILGPLLFNIFMCDMFLILKTASFTGYADDNTPFVVRENTTNVIKALEDIGENFTKWFSDNQMRLNTDKCHVLLNSQGPNTIKIGNLYIKNSSCENMLGINFDYELKFTNHIDEI